MTKKNLAAAIGALGLMAVGFSAQACQTSAWSEVQGEVATTGLQAGGPLEGITRYSGECGLAVRNSGEYVGDFSPGNETEMTARFFVYGANASSKIFEAYGDEAGGSPVFAINYDQGTGFTVSSGGNTSSAVAAIADNWNIVEARYDASGDVELWVNQAATGGGGADASVTAGGGSISSARLGALDGTVTSQLVFDDYEARRTTQIGPLSVGGNNVVACDADADGAINSLDARAYLLESVFLGNVTGQADCDRNGTVNSLDARQALLISVFIEPTPTY